jgi:hypothetical protein
MIPALTSQGATVGRKMDLDKKAQDRTNISRFLVPLFGLGILFSGCDHGTPSLARVSGKILFQNRPLPGGAIVFVPDADRGNNGPLAQGTIQPGGAYTIQTSGQDGAYPGWYRVTVIAVDRGYQSIGSPPRALVPEKYRDPQLSDLTCEVKQGQENSINFNLTP